MNKEVVRQHADLAREDADVRSVVVRIEHTQPAREHRPFRCEQLHQVGLVKEELFRSDTLRDLPEALVGVIAKAVHDGRATAQNDQVSQRDPLLSAVLGVEVSLDASLLPGQARRADGSDRGVAARVALRYVAWRSTLHVLVQLVEGLDLREPPVQCRHDRRVEVAARVGVDGGDCAFD